MGSAWLPVHIRWEIRRDLPEVLEIERVSETYPWSEQDFLRALRLQNCIAMVAEMKEQVLGHMLYELHKNRLHVIKLGVAPEFRRKGVGTQLVRKLVSKLSSHRRSRLTIEVRETNLGAQLFFKKLGFEAVRVLRNYFEDSGEDAYRMVYRLKEEVREEACTRF